MIKSINFFNMFFLSLPHRPPFQEVGRKEGEVNEFGNKTRRENRFK